MFVHGIQIQSRPTSGTRAFTDSEEQQIYQLHAQGMRKERLAADLDVSLNTIKNVIARQRKRKEPGTNPAPVSSSESDSNTRKSSVAQASDVTGAQPEPTEEVA